MVFLSTLIGLVLTISMYLSAPVFAHSHLEADYVSWGTDEFELFGLTRSELSKSFAGRLDFDQEFHHAYVGSNHNIGPQFILAFKNGRISSVQRMFIDGGGCHIMGPLLNSQKEALQFSINGLSKLSGINPKEKAKLATARLLLSHLDGSKKEKKP